VTNVTAEKLFGGKIWNFEVASEPLSRGERAAEMGLAPTAVHKYFLLAAVIATGIALIMVEVHEHSPWWEILCAVGFGWALGQLLRWEQPR
jgi:hypothetical protein